MGTAFLPYGMVIIHSIEKEAELGVGRSDSGSSTQEGGLRSLSEAQNRSVFRAWSQTSGPGPAAAGRLQAGGGPKLPAPSPPPQPPPCLGWGGCLQPEVATCLARLVPANGCGSQAGSGGTGHSFDFTENSNISSRSLPNAALASYQHSLPAE